MCHNLVTSFSAIEDDTATEPVTTVPCRTYKLPIRLAFKRTREPFDTFRTPPSAEYLHPRDSRVPSEIKFRFNSGIWRTSEKVLMTPSSVLI